MTGKAKYLQPVGLAVLILLALFGAYALAAPTGVAAESEEGLGSVVVLCSSCAFSGMPRQGHVILMDGRTGEIWAYSEEAMSGAGTPMYLGRMQELGQPVVKSK